MWGDYTLYLSAVIISGAGLVGLAFYVWQQRRAPGARGFAAMLAFTAVYTLAIIAALLCHSPEAAFVWYNVRRIAAFFVPLGWLAFTLEFGQFGAWRNSWHWFGTALIPVTLTILALTNPSHELLWIVPPTSQLPWPYLFTQVQNGPLGFLNPMYMGLSYALSLLALWRKAARTPGIYRRQMLLITAAALLPGLFSIFRLIIPGLHNNRVPGDPFAFLAMGVLLTWGLFRLRLFDLKPVARETLIQTMSDGVLVLDDQERLIDFNPAMQRILESQGFHARMGQPLAALLPAGESAAILTEIDLTFFHEGQPRTYNLSISPLSDQRGRVSGRLIVFRDITAFKQAEAALRNYASDLEASNAELDAFAHTVAHDLKSPLTIIVGFGAFLDERLERLSTEIAHENLQRIVQTGKKMVNIIDELLLLAGIRRIEDVAREPLAMGDILAEVQTRLGPEIAAAGADWRAPVVWPMALGYGPWLEEVWVNYISNALKYGGAPPLVELGYTIPQAGTSGPQPASGIKFWVRDNGPGLTAEQCAKLFTSFTRLDNTRAQGHGLGLSIVQRIVNKLGGEVGVESTPGAGSTFWFTLPPAP